MAACELLVPYGLTLDNLIPLFLSYSVFFLSVFALALRTLLAYARACSPLIPCNN
jgi:hypothetical protein